MNGTLVKVEPAISKTYQNFSCIDHKQMMVETEITTNGVRFNKRAIRL
jgi:hypothetical protein